jgi:hypothetical protein
MGAMEGTCLIYFMVVIISCTLVPIRQLTKLA